MTTTDTDLRERQSNFAVNLGLFYNIILSVAKTFFGIFGHSSALLADGINSTSDVVYYIAVKVCLKKANKPSDENHPFGHKQLENVASIVVAAFIVTTAIAIAWKSLDSVYNILSKHHEPQEILPITLYVAIFTLISKVILSFYTVLIGKRTKNTAIQALASDHINDIFASLAVIVGIIFAEVGFTWVDPLVGIIVAVFIMRTGFDILRVSAKGLMDIAPNENMKALVYSVAKDMSEDVVVQSILSHRYGPYYSLNITLGINGSLSMDKGHNLADIFENELMQKDSNLKYVFIHYHPLIADS